MLTEPLRDNRHICNKWVELFDLFSQPCMCGVNPLLLLPRLSFHGLNLVLQFDNLLHLVELSFLLELLVERLLVFVTLFLGRVNRLH